MRMQGCGQPPLSCREIRNRAAGSGDSGSTVPINGLISLNGGDD
jgi:hypothetical protein